METSGEVPYFCRFFRSIPTFADRTPLSPYFSGLANTLGAPTFAENGKDLLENSKKQGIVKFVVLYFVVVVIILIRLEITPKKKEGKRRKTVEFGHYFKIERAGTLLGSY